MKKDTATVAKKSPLMPTSLATSTTEIVSLLNNISYMTFLIGSTNPRTTNDWVGETEKALHKVLENKIFHTDEFVSKIAKDACTRGSSLIACNMQNVALFSPEISKDAGSGPEQN